MNPELAYFLKVNAGIALFYAFYRLFFYRDTFFTWRRTALLCFFILSFIYPLMNLQEWIKGHEPMVAMADLYASAVLPEFTITPTDIVNWKEIFILSSGYLYWGGVLLLLLRFFIQFISIIRLRLHCRSEIIRGTRIYQLPQASGPFSFFHWIFIHPTSHTNEELDEILTHELAHVRQHHSVDVLFSELACIACWFNPFVWLIKREIRSNLEYLADRRVIESGHNYQSYQFHLLGLAHQKAAANLSNSFNVLPLKNRIKMMNKKRTKEIGRTKYLMFLPLAALLMIISNIEVVARTTKSIAKEVIQNVEQTVNERLTESPATEQVPPQDKKGVKQVTPTKKQTPAQVDGEDPVFEVVEDMPDFVGGLDGLMSYLSKNIKYPEAAIKKNIQGRVIIQFIVRKDGKVSNPEVIRSVSPELDAEALRVVSAMPNWAPGRQKGKLVSVRYTVPIMFGIPGNKATKPTDSSKTTINEPQSQQKKPGDNTVFEVVEQMPTFPGGNQVMMEYIAKNMKYPSAAIKSGTQGRVILSMVIDKEGNVTQPRVVKSVSPELDAEAIRLIKTMPRWIPAKQRGIPVNVKYTLPIMFMMQ